MRAFARSLREAFGLFAVIRREFLRFAIYSGVNILAGALGLFAPIAAGLYLDPGPMRDLTHVLRDGNGYTFALALLTASCAFLLNDVIDHRKTNYVGLRLFAGGLAATLLVTLAFSSGMHFLAQVFETLGAAAAETGPKNTPSVLRWTGRETWQAVLVAATVLYGTWLFCLQRIDEYEGDFAQSLRDGRSDLITRAQSATSGSGIQA